MKHIFCGLFVLFSTVSAGIQVDMPPHCKLALDRGKDCHKNGTIRFYMDAEQLTCFPFKYLGCGGNGNNFESASDCSNCLPMDLSFCPANSDPISDSKGSSYCDQQVKCAKGATCVSGWPGGMCCDSEIVKRSQLDESPTCPKGKEVVKKEKFGFDLIHVGRSCTHDFCPRGSSCHKGEFIAYCCK